MLTVYIKHNNLSPLDIEFARLASPREKERVKTFLEDGGYFTFYGINTNQNYNNRDVILDYTSESPMAVLFYREINSSHGLQEQYIRTEIFSITEVAYLFTRMRYRQKSESDLNSLFLVPSPDTGNEIVI